MALNFCRSIPIELTHGSYHSSSRVATFIYYRRLSVDWSKAPRGRGSARIEFSGGNTNFTVNVSTFNPVEPTGETLQGFVEADGYVSIEAEHYTKKTDARANRWIRIPNYGHTLSGMRVDGPPETLATPGKDSPCLEYRM